MKTSNYEFGIRNVSQFIWFLLGLLITSEKCLAQTQSGIRVIEAGAIPYLEFLSKAEFDQRFPGQIKASRTKLDNGWYVIYVHENLNYYFGPVLLKSTGKDYFNQLSLIVDAAVKQRPTIRNYQLELSFEPAIEDSENSGNSDESANGSSAENGQNPSRKPAKSTGFWSFIRRVFSI